MDGERLSMSDKKQVEFRYYDIPLGDIVFPLTGPDLRHERELFPETLRKVHEHEADGLCEFCPDPEGVYAASGDGHDSDDGLRKGRVRKYFHLYPELQANYRMYSE